MAIVDHGVAHTYAQLRDRAAEIGSLLVASGVDPGDRVAMFLDRGFDAAAAMFAVYAIGGVAVAVNERLRPRQLEYAAAHVGARVLLTQAGLMARQLRPVVTSATVLDLARALGAAAPRAPRVDILPRAASDLAQLIFTSGSTGMPKAAMFTHGAIAAGVANVSSYLEPLPTDRVASLLAFSAVYGLNQLLCTVRAGATLVVETSALPSTLVESIRAHEVSVLAAVPPLWLQLLSVPSFARGAISSLRQMQNAGAHLPVHAVRALRRAQPHAALYLQYGQTETFRGSYLSPNIVDRRPDSMGRAIPGAELLLVDDALRPCAPGEVGEIVHCGETIALGYWNDDDATERVFRPHPFSLPGVDPPRVVFSGDLARRDEEGFLYFVARRDRLIKSLGFRIGPDEIADVVYASGEVRECAIGTESDPVRGERIVAYVVLGDSGCAERLTRFCGVELPRHMQPARIVTLDSLPRLASGKYDFGAMRDATATVSVAAR